MSKKLLARLMKLEAAVPELRLPLVFVKEETPGRYRTNLVPQLLSEDEVDEHISKAKPLATFYIHRIEEPPPVYPEDLMEENQGITEGPGADRIRARWEWQQRTYPATTLDPEEYEAQLMYGRELLAAAMRGASDELQELAEGLNTQSERTCEHTRDRDVE